MTGRHLITYKTERASADLNNETAFNFKRQPIQTSGPFFRPYYQHKAPFIPDERRIWQKFFLCKSSADLFSCSFRLVPHSDRNNRMTSKPACVHTGLQSITQWFFFEVMCCPCLNLVCNGCALEYGKRFFCLKT
jgi:hypothetical protein